jgi:tRNA (cytidine/uridine-2'-O-)-methyltransferase
MPIPAMPVLATPVPPLEIVLVSPQIPPNTGNVARSCAVTGSRLHLVEPLGFSLDEKHLRRAGLDYWKSLEPAIYLDWSDFDRRTLRGRVQKLHLFTGRGGRGLWEVRFAPGDFLVFGAEQHGLPPALLAAWPERTVAIPVAEGARSLNLAVAVAIGLYEALRQVSE